MSFLKPLMGGVDPSRVSQIADRIGAGMNQIATAGGAQPGYVAPAAQQSEAPQAAPVNHLQLIDPATLSGILTQFGPLRRDPMKVYNQ